MHLLTGPHIIVLGEAHLRRILKAYASYYNKARTHLTAYCPKCQHSERLDVRKLVDRYGGDIDPAEIAPHCEGD